MASLWTWLNLRSAQVSNEQLRAVSSGFLHGFLDETVKLTPAPRRLGQAPGLPLGGMFFDVGRDEIFDVAAAADENFAVWVHDVAVAVADPFIAGDAAFGSIQHHVVATDEINIVFNGPGAVVGADLHEVGDEAVV